MRNRGVAIAVAVLTAATSLPRATGEPAASPPAHREERDDDPGKPRLTEQARAQSQPVVRGNHRSIQVNVDAAGLNIVGDAANEPSIAIDPTDPNNIVIAWRQFDTVASNFRQAGYAYSHDAGATWTFPGVLQPGQFRSDPVLAASTSGVFYYYSLSSATSAQLFISKDKGHTWAGPYNGFGGDKEWLTVDTTGGRGDGILHGIWNSEYTCCARQTDYTRSRSAGQSFDGPYATPAKTKWGTVDVGPDGEVYIAGSDLVAGVPPNHQVLRSSNAGDPGQVPYFEGWNSDVSLGGDTRTGGPPNPGGLLGQAWVAADRTSTATRGNVYILASLDPPGDDPLDVLFVRSTDRGVTWSEPIRINQDPVGAWQWFGMMSIAPTGRIDVFWNDTRSDPSGTVSEGYYAYSIDAGRTWSAGLAVTPPWDSGVGYPNQNKIGDYYHMISDADGVSIAYAATFQGEQDVYFLRAGDCDGNGRHDAVDIVARPDADCDRDGVLDVCIGGVLEVCDDGRDNDCDGLSDCLDPDCAGAAGCPCDFDGACEAGETCRNCASDCARGTMWCGNGVCEPGNRENCLSCPKDCNGQLSGRFSSLFCCGSVAGRQLTRCGDPRCSSGRFACGLQPFCCGDGQCDAGEGAGVCAIDCAEPPAAISTKQ